MFEHASICLKRLVPPNLDDSDFPVVLAEEFCCSVPTVFEGGLGHGGNKGLRATSVR